MGDSGSASKVIFPLQFIAIQITPDWTPRIVAVKEEAHPKGLPVKHCNSDHSRLETADCGGQKGSPSIRISSEALRFRSLAIGVRSAASFSDN
jgi:hypothetical protein